MITIVNRKIHRGESIYVGRPSVLGNPYRIGQDGNRAQVIQMYRRFLWKEIQSGAGAVHDELHRLAKLAKRSDLILSCWCHPLQCHATCLKNCIEYLNRSDGAPSTE